MDLLASTSSLYEKVCQDEQIHLRPEEAVESFFGKADDGFVFVERSVEHKRDAGQVAELFDQSMITRIGFLVNRLQSPGSVDMNNGRNHVPIFGTNLEHFHHERDVVVG